MEYLKNTVQRLDSLSRASLSADSDGLLTLGDRELDGERRRNLLSFATAARETAEAVSSPSLLLGHASESDEYGDVPFSITIDRDEDITHRSPNDIARLILNQLHLTYTLIVEDDAIAQRLPKQSERLLSEDQKQHVIDSCAIVGQPTLDFSASISDTEKLHMWALRIVERQYVGLLSISVNT
ncbi:hypothetical protein E3P99_03245 [Wallemia hederae]|uniref:Uncharacterized protein n=1 Tax=Wallemia hederae TaxID=1540922 RepID=A0A4V4LSP8_9BASI|nr:hypothetical protein E3P99_03245 [Wallemia hederae]